MAILKLQNLKKVYGGRTVVKDVSLEVDSGKVIGLLGPNGAGKTTTFYMAVGMIRPESGKVPNDFTGVHLQADILDHRPAAV
ncbi:MAG: ATP-binding cassette domain-containing protein, partial [Desulfosarcinaceae bacterium]